MPDTRLPAIPRRILLALSAGDMTLLDAQRETGLKKNKLFRAIAKLVLRGDAPDDLLRFQSIKTVYDTLSPDAVQTVEAGEVASLRRKLKEAQTRARDAEEIARDQNSLAEIIGGLIAAPAKPPSWVTDSVSHIINGKTSSVPILCLGDWHYGEVVRPSEAGGYQFNAEIAESRIRKTIEKTVSLTRDALAGLEYPGIICALLGDMTSGALHPELAESDEYSVFMSILRVRDLIVGAIRSLADEFGRVFVPTAVGNHGRLLDRKPRAKGYSQRNTDWLVYQLVARHFEGDPRVTVMVPDSGETVFRVFGRTFLLTHGDQLGTRGGDGIIGAIGPIMRGSLKTLRSVQSLGIDIDHLIVGHWHQSIYLPQVTVNGTIKGPDEYSLKLLRAPAEDPSQTLMVMHPQHGLTFRQPLFLKDDACPDRTRQSVTDRWIEVLGDAA